MPTISGIEFLKGVKEFYPLLPVVVITAYPSIELAVTAMKEGAVDFVAKPFNVEHVKIVAEKAISLGRLLRDNAKLAQEVSEKKTIERLNKRLQDKIRELTTLYTISETVNNTLSTDELFEKVLELSISISESERATLMVLDRESGELHGHIAVGMDRENIKKLKIPVGVGLPGMAAEIKRHLKEFCTEDGLNLSGGLKEDGTPFLSIPILIGGQVFGVVNLTGKADKTDFRYNTVNLLLELVRKASLRLENNALYESVTTNIRETLATLVGTLEAKDQYTKEHSKRVVGYAVAIAREMRCSSHELESIKFAGYLHDIGKIGVRDAILQKPGKHSPEERAIMRNHPVIGDAILRGLSLSATEKAIVRNHHEWWNGKGYPDGLAGKEIPLVARILSVADTFDAMTSTRPYRLAKGYKETEAELLKYCGVQFDREVVRAFQRTNLGVGVRSQLNIQ